MRCWLIGVLFLIVGCSPSRKIQKMVDAHEKEFKHHMGLLIINPATNKIIFNHNEDKFFTPASNTKILTFYTALKTLKDSTITFFVKKTGDSVILWPAADPTFLNPEFPELSAYDKLRHLDDDVYVSFNHDFVEPWGAGWAWEDYTYTADRSAFPIYGNYSSLYINESQLAVSAPYFKRHYWLQDTVKSIRAVRDLHSNTINFYPGEAAESDTIKIPFITSSFLSTELLSDTLNRYIRSISAPIPENYQMIYGQPIDTVYKKLMQESNNFIAEQLLLQSSLILKDTLNSQMAIEYAQKYYLTFLPHQPIWIDGSGLSRYNQITPTSIVALWEQLLEEFGRERIFPLLATGGVSGTLENYYLAKEPYIFGKTGTLRNNHNLSGYLVTKSGDLLIFAFMNNNYPTSSYPIKKAMEQILWEIHMKY